MSKAKNQNFSKNQKTNNTEPKLFVIMCHLCFSWCVEFNIVVLRLSRAHFISPLMHT